MTTTITEMIELKKDYNKEKLCNYFCNLCELKYIDLFDPFIFWEFVKYTTLSNGSSLDIQIKDNRWGKKRYYVRFCNSGQKGEYFEDLEYGILYMITKTLKSQIEYFNIMRLKYPKADVDYKKWENYKQEIRNIAFNNYLNKQGR